MQLRFLHAAALIAAALVSLASADARAANVCVQANQEAQDLRTAGKFREARAQLLVCAAKSCNTVIRNDCEKWIRDLDEKTPTIIVRVVDARGQDVLDARVTIDDARIELNGKPVQVDPGQRTIKARTKNGEGETKVLTAQGEKDRVVEVKLPAERSHGNGNGNGNTSAPIEGPKETPAPPPGSPTPILALTLGAVGVVALGAFGFFELTGHSDFNDLKDGCGKTGTCTDAEIDPVKSKFVAAGVSLGVSVVALGAAAILYLTRPKSTDTAFRFSPVIRF